jgi:hypothetical protein
VSLADVTLSYTFRPAILGAHYTVYVAEVQFLSPGKMVT